MISPYDFQQGKIVVAKKDILSQTQCVNKNTVTVVERIIEKDPSAIVILNGDHGLRPVTKSGVLDTKYTDQLDAHSQVLAAVRLPTTCHADISSNMFLKDILSYVRFCISDIERKTAN